VLDNAQAVARANPITYVNHAALLSCSCMFRDTFVSPSQTLILHTALRAAGVASTRYVLEGAGHGDLAVQAGDPSAALPWSTEQVMTLMTGFLHSELPSQ